MKHSKYCTFFPRTWCVTHQYSKRAVCFTRTQSYNIKELKFCMCSCQCTVITLNNKQFRIESHMIYFKRLFYMFFHLVSSFTLLIISTWKNPQYTPWADVYWSEWFIVSCPACSLTACSLSIVPLKELQKSNQNREHTLLMCWRSIIHIQTPWSICTTFIYSEAGTMDSCTKYERKIKQKSHFESHSQPLI